MSRILIAIAYGIGGMFVAVVLLALLSTTFGISNTGTPAQVITWGAFIVFGYFGLVGRKKKSNVGTPPPADEA